MKNDTYYKQCTYTTKTDNGELVGIAWIPENLAIVGKKVYFGNKTKTPKQVWVVKTVSDVRIAGSYLQEHERDYLTQREASDI